MIGRHGRRNIWVNDTERNGAIQEGTGFSMTIRMGWTIPMMCAVFGCTEAELPGEYFRIQASGDVNECTGAAASLKEQFTYRLIVDGSTVDIAVGPDVFATGFIEGCELDYESVVWEERRDGGEIAWQLRGSATINLRGECDLQLPGGESWLGAEVFQLVSADDELGLSPGCEYSSNLSGDLVKSVE